jgi:hypothetical protein
LSRVTKAYLTVWATATGEQVVLKPGIVLEDCHTVRLNTRSSSYSMEFRVAGTGYRCPLYEFQPRTEILAIAEAPAGQAETVERARVRAETTPIAKAE